jgi:hypothetical protein
MDSALIVHSPISKGILSVFCEVEESSENAGRSLVNAISQPYKDKDTMIQGYKDGLLLSNKIWFQEGKDSFVISLQV